MRWKDGIGWLLAVAALAAGGYPAAAQAASRLDRPGTVALGGGGGYGLTAGEGRYGLDFGGGGSYHFVIRYTAAPHWVLGFHFQNQNFSWEDAIRTETDTYAIEPYDDMVMTTFEGQICWYPASQVDSRQYLFAGVGVYRPELRRSKEDVVFPGENIFLSLGLGTELFLRENWALDITGRGMALFGTGYADPEVNGLTDFELQQVRDTPDLSLGFQIQAGILYYVLK